MRSGYSGLKQKKSLGQVFLKESWPLQEMIGKLIDWNVERVLEIGPGGGVLTELLSASGFNVTAVEADERFVRILQRDLIHVDTIHCDVLKFDLEDWLRRNNSHSCAVVGNLPYHLSSPILDWLFPHFSQCQGALFMLQKEFGERLYGEVGTKSYSRLSVFSQLQAHAELLTKVGRTCFKPIPKVDSVIVSLKPRPFLLNESQMHKVQIISKSAFSQRRKKLRNAIKPWIKGVDLEKTFDLDQRPGCVSPESFVELAKQVFPETFC